MGFLGDLGKGFIRSAVNQVGRDTGKVVSNSIYGDAHATPIRNVSYNNSVYIETTSGEELDIEKLRETAEKDGWKPNYSTYSSKWNNPFGWIVKIIIWGITLVIGVFLYPISTEIPIVPVILTFNGLRKFFRTKAVWEKEGIAKSYTQDRRYKSGYRIEYVQATEKVKLPCNKKDKKNLFIYGTIDILLALSLYFGASHYGDIYSKIWSRESIIKESTKIIESRPKEVEDSIQSLKDIKSWKSIDKEYYNEKMKNFKELEDWKYQRYINAIKRLDSINNIIKQESLNSNK